MDLYSSVSYELSKRITQRYSSSFSVSSRLFDKTIRPHIYAIYGLVRIADEIVDSYQGKTTRQILDALESETYEALKSGYSTNPIVHAFACTARQYNIDKQLIAPFFASMRIDADKNYTPEQYETYIYGSAEVIGLMCLKVFCAGDETSYCTLAPGASSLGSAYQKINFLRDFAADYAQLGRIYFKDVTFEQFNDADRDAIITDIRRDLNRAKHAVVALPPSAKKAVLTSYNLYSALLRKLADTPAENLKRNRVRISSAHKLRIILLSLATRRAA